MNKNVRVIYRKVTDKFKKNGYINLNHRLVNTKDDLVDIASIFRSPEYETFRMVYMKDKNIVGYESISSRTPISVNLFRTKNNYTNFEKGFYKIKDRMNRLSANGYYMVHNHPSGNAQASEEDVRITKEFMNKVEGFKGHLILGTDEYAWIEQDKKQYSNLRVDNYQPINFKKADKFSKMMNKKSIYNVQISSRTDLVSFMEHLKSNKDYSTAIMTDSRNGVRMIFDIPNSMLNQRMEQLNGFFKNQARISGATKVLFATTDERAFKRSQDHLYYGTFIDSILYKEIENNKIVLRDSSQDLSKKELFEDEIRPNKSPLINFAGMITKGNRLVFQEPNSIQFNLSDNKDDYIEIPLKEKEIDLDREDNFEPKKNQIKVLLKRVGKEPIVKVIPNTLEAKQKLVDGLIEVVPYQNGTLLICNEEGKILGLEKNLSFDYDYIAGDCFVIGDDYERGDFKSLTKEQIIKAKQDLKRRSFQYESPRGYLKQDEEREL